MSCGPAPGGVGDAQALRCPQLPDLLPDTAPHGATARRILVVAVELFAHRGVHGTTVRDIAAGAGIRAPSIYEHFSSKEALVGELMRIGHDHALGSFDSRLRTVGEDPLDRLDAAVGALVDLHSTHPMLMRVLTDDVHGLDPTTVQPAASARLEMSLRLAQIIHDGERAGVMSAPNLITTVAAVHGLFIRIPHWFTSGDDYGIAELTEDYRHLVRSMLGAPVSPR